MRRSLRYTGAPMAIPPGVSVGRSGLSAGAALRAGNSATYAHCRAGAPRWRPNPRGKIVLLQPRVGYMDSMRSKPALPLSLLHAASLVAERYEVVIIDQRVAGDWQQRLVRELEHGPLLVGITCYTGPMIQRA